MAAVSRKLGLEPMPWQQLVYDVGSEIDSDTGLPAYREIVMTVPRQSAKTTSVFVFQCDRAINWLTPQHIAYTAQTGLDARSKMVKDQMPLLHRSELRATVEATLKGAAYTAIEFKNGSRIEALATSEDSGHGKTIGLGVIDEAMADEDDRREQALLPAMLTVADAQLLIPSTAGTDKSVYLRRKVDQGRAAVADGLTSGIAYFEWSADENADPDDPATWWSCMPALGFTQSEATVAHARLTMTDGEFRRAMLNQWTTSDERVIPVAVWAAVQSPNAAPDRPVFGADITPSRSAAAIVAADRAGNVELVESRAGVAWLLPRLQELHERHGGLIVVDSYGPAGGLVEDLARVGVEARGFTTAEMKYACGRLFDLVADRKLRVRPDRMLDAAVAGAVQRTVGDAWLWGRAKSDVDISPLVAMTLAVDAALVPPADDGPPSISFV